MKKYIFKSPVLFMVSIIFMIIDCAMGTFFSIILGRIVDAENAADIEERLLKDPDITLIEITHNITDEHIARFDSALRI